MPENGSVSFIADVVTPNIPLRTIPPKHPYSKFFSKNIKYIFSFNIKFHYIS